MEYDCNIVNYLINKVHEEDGVEDIESKIRITSEILSNRDILIQYPAFYDEECLLSIVNWAYKIRKVEVSNKELLLKNIINILENFPITPCDLVSFSFISKLNKINQHLKFTNILLYQKIKQIKLYWKSLILYYQQQVSKNDFLGKKRIIMNIYENDCKNYFDQPCNSMHKKVTWRNDNDLVEVVQFDPNNVILLDCISGSMPQEGSME